MERIDAVELTDRLHAEQGRGDPFAAAVRATRMPMIITDPRQIDNPIVFCNDAFCRLTGYERDEVLGRNCRFLQGPDTDAGDVALIRQAIEARTDVSVEILNHKKDGEPFWNALYISPVFSESGELQFYFASQFDVTDRKEREIAAVEGKEFFERAVRERTAELEAALAQKTMLLHEVDHRVKNNLQMVAAMIRNQARFSGAPAVQDSLVATLARVETLGAVHRRLYESKDIATFSVGEFIGEIASGVIESAGQSRIRLELDLEPVEVASASASPLALLVNELLTNALKHAFPGERDTGRIRVATRNDGTTATLIVEDDGVGLGATGRTERKTFGHRLVDSLVRQIRGTLEWTDAQPGTRATVAFPLQAGRGRP
ncbi:MULTISPECIES: PAS domain-containing protein [unclassified Aureimonas]|uniref:PAS domain-containing protein n=1 Tax=unclassified Aureimonas TaxID=2615206 RepID=UPI0006F88124|nr:MULTISPECIES: PAS domain-containing protein [unclassified Aureimonas]KQT60647.1 histidine kinase [Aureimonas sp. Leaf460]KQT68776.1 histidine kinase [Aureimonas sp. Leaf427]